MLARYFSPDVLREGFSTNFSSFRKLLLRFAFGLHDCIFTFHLPKFMILFILFEYNFRFLNYAFLILTTQLSLSIFLLPVSKPLLIQCMQCCCASTLVSFSLYATCNLILCHPIDGRTVAKFLAFWFFFVSWMLALSNTYSCTVVLPEEILNQIFVIILSRAPFPLVGLLASWSVKESLTISSMVYDAE